MSRYKGKRIVPKHCGVWDSGNSYEMLSLVLNSETGDSYISRKDVPAGIDIFNQEYWALSSIFSSQIESLRTLDTTDSTVTFTSADALEPAEWTDVDLLTSGEKHYSVFGKISTMFKNIRFLYRMLGSTDIDSIGDGTVTGALDKLNRAMEDEGGDTVADTAEDTVTFTSADALEPAEWTDVDVLASGEKHSSIFNKISVMFKNIRYLYKVLGTEDISSLGDGTITGALNALNTGKDDSGDDEDSGDGYLKMYTLESTSSDLDSDLQALFDTFPTGCFAICATANTYCYGYFGYKVDLYGGSGVIIRMNFSSSTETIQYTRILSGMWWPTWTDL